MPCHGVKKHLTAGVALSCALRLCAALEWELEDKAVLVQDTVELRRPDPSAPTRGAVAALDPFTAVHYTNVKKLPGLGDDKLWGGDTDKGHGAIFVSDGPKSQLYGALGGGNKDDGTSHGVYGGISSDRPGQMLFAGGWQGTPGTVKVQHTQPSPMGGRDATIIEHKFGSVLPGGGGLPPLPQISKAASAAAGGAAAAASWPPLEGSLTDILKQPSVADMITVAVRKQDVPRRAAWGKDDVLGSAGKLIKVGSYKDGIGGVGGYSAADQSYHFVYGTGAWIHDGGAGGKPLQGGGTIGTVVGKPGSMYINHVQPTADGGANVTYVKSRTVHMSQKELDKLLASGDYAPASVSTSGDSSVSSPSSTSGSPSAPSSSGSSPSPSSGPSASSAIPSTTSSSSSSSSTSAIAPEATTSQEAATTAQAEASSTSEVTTTESAAGTTSAPATAAPVATVWGKITDKMGDISSGVSSKVEGMLPPKASSTWGAQAAGDVADTVTNTLNPIKEKADKLLNETLKVKEGLLHTADAAMSKKTKRIYGLTVDPAVEKLELELSHGIRQVLARWESLREEIINATLNLTTGLRAGGQPRLADLVEKPLKIVSAAAGAFQKRIGDAIEGAPGIGQLPGPQVNVRLEQIDKTLYSASRVLGAFGPGFLAPVQDLVDRFADALSSSGLADPSQVQNAFSSIEHQTTAIQWRVRDAGRELVMGAHQALSDMAVKLEQPALTWPPKGVTPEETTVWSIGQAAAEAGEKVESWLPYSGATSGLRLGLSLVATSCSLLLVPSFIA